MTTAVPGLIKIGKAGFFAESKIRTHNALIKKSKYPPIDISIADVQTKNGKVVHCTCARERELFRKLEAINKEPYVLIENYPVSKESDIPREARKEMELLLQRLQILNTWTKTNSLSRLIKLSLLKER